MTALLSDEWASGVLQTPGARPFVNMPEDLEPYGVLYAPEQMALLHAGALFRPDYYDRMVALTLQVLPDPVFPNSAALGLHALTLDEYGVLAPVVVPAVVEIDCSEWEFFDESEPNWRRFPALLGRKHIWSPTTGTLVESLEPVRLWNLWPLNGYGDQELVENATQEWMEENWVPYLKWLHLRDNSDALPCSYEGTPGGLHDHGPDYEGYHYQCEEPVLQTWFDKYELDHVTHDDDGDPYPKPLEAGLGGLHHLGPVWEHLIQTSVTSTFNAMSAYPHWEQDEIARTERHYSPWLSSY